MEKNEFDQFAEKYDEILCDSIPGSLSENPYFAEYKIKLISNLLSSDEPRKILDFGCGAGRGLPYLRQYFSNADIWGFDVSTASLDIAKNTILDVSLVSDMTDTENNSFDLIVAANVFHHIPPEERVHALLSCYDALSENGKMFIFEHNPYNPATRWIFERCPFDVDAEMLSLSQAKKIAAQAHFKVTNRAYTLFFPAPLAWLRRFEPLLKYVPLGAQYYVQLEK